MPTSEKAVRQALSYAFDRKSVVSGLLEGRATVPPGPIPPISWAYDPSVSTYDFNPQKATELLTVAGFTKGAEGILQKDGKPLQVDFFVVKGVPLLEGIVLQAQKNWGAIGVKVNPQFMDFNTMNAQYIQPGNFDISFGGFSMGLDPDPYGLFHSSTAKPNDKGLVLGFNQARYRNPQADSLLEQGRLETDKEKRKQIYSQFQRIVIEDAPQIWVYANVWTDFVSTKVKGALNYKGSGVDGVWQWYLNEQ